MKDFNQNSIFVFKDKKLYGKIKGQSFYKNAKNSFMLANECWDELLDLLPQGLDLEIMKNAFGLKDEKELFAYITNTTGDFSFCQTSEYKSKKPKPSTLKTQNFAFPNELELFINIDYSQLYAHSGTKPNQMLSLSGYQHKLQVMINEKELKEAYGDFILKPASQELSKAAINEHLNTTFLREFGFDVPFNAIIYDSRYGEYSYLIKRFDIGKKGEKRELISLNALMRSKRPA